MRIHNQIQKITHLLFILLFTFSIGLAQQAPIDIQQEFRKSAKKIRTKYEHNAYKLKPSKAAHMGLRFWRNYNNDKYKYLLLQGINHTSDKLDELVEIGLAKESLEAYALQKNESYKATTKKKKRRKKTFKSFPMYRVMGTKILRHVARLDELGLRHEHHEELVSLLKGYDFEKAFTDSKMIKAWGAQLANQVYWLHNLGIADHREQFKLAVAQTYPHAADATLSKQQFGNKIYTLTHIIIAASGYYSHQVAYEDHKEIVDYFRANVDTILERCKEDIIIEVGLSLLLVDESYPEINEIRNFIHHKVDKSKKMVLSESGKSKIAQGEHRNIIAVLLLDWQGSSTVPTFDDIKGMKSLFSENLVVK